MSTQDHSTQQNLAITGPTGSDDSKRKIPRYPFGEDVTTPSVELQQFLAKYPMIGDELVRQSQQAVDSRSTWVISVRDEHVEDRKHVMKVTATIEFKSTSEGISSTQYVQINHVQTDDEIARPIYRVIVFEFHTASTKEHSVKVINHDQVNDSGIVFDQSILQTFINRGYAEPEVIDQQTWFSFSSLHRKDLITAVLNKTRALDASAHPLVPLWEFDDITIIVNNVDDINHEYQVTVYYADETLLTLGVEVRTVADHNYHVTVDDDWWVTPEPVDAERAIKAVNNASIPATDTIEGTSPDGEVTLLKES